MSLLLSCPVADTVNVTTMNATIASTAAATDTSSGHRYNNLLDRLTHVLSHHPNYLELFLRTHNFLLRGDGPLNSDYRNFIAIMVSESRSCRDKMHTHTLDDVIVDEGHHSILCR